MTSACARWADDDPDGSAGDDDDRLGGEVVQHDLLDDHDLGDDQHRLDVLGGLPTG